MAQRQPGQVRDALKAVFKEHVDETVWSALGFLGDSGSVILSLLSAQYSRSV